MVLGEGPNWSRRVPSKKFKICDPPFYECPQIPNFHSTGLNIMKETPKNKAPNPKLRLFLCLDLHLFTYAMVLFFTFTICMLELVPQEFVCAHRTTVDVLIDRSLTFSSWPRVRGFAGLHKMSENLVTHHFVHRPVEKLTHSQC